VPSRWSNDEGHVGIEVLEHIDVGLPGVGEDGMPGRNVQCVARHGKLPPRRHEELPPPWIAEERANERGTNHGRLVVE